MKLTRVLVVDDDPNLSRLVATILDRTRVFETRTENRSLHAPNTARQFNPDVVLLDVDMPGRSGGDVAQEMQRDPALRDIPIVFLTALIEHREAGVRSVSGHTVRYIAKPPNPLELIDALDEALNRPVAPVS